MKIRITGLPNKNIRIPKPFAFGGNLGTNGSDFNNNLTYFNVPTRHETNPNGGIPQGISPDGLPNLVEGKEENKKSDGGEIKWNSENYIFSDRLSPSEALIERWKLPKSFLDITYADLVRKSPVIKESELRPNDPNSQRTREKFLADVAEDQELTKKQKEAAEMLQQLSQMSDDELMALGAQMSLLLQEAARQQEMELLTLLPADYNTLALNALLENILSQELINQMALLENLNLPQMVGAEGGTLLKDGGKKVTNKEILKRYDRMIDDSIERFKYPNGSPYKRSKLDILLGVDLRTINLLNDPYYYSLTNPPTLEERGKSLLQTLYNKGKKLVDKVSDIVQDTPTPNTTSGAGYIPSHTFRNGGYKYKDTYKPLDLNTEEGQLRLIEYFITHPKSSPIDAWLYFMPKPSDFEEDSQALFYELELQRILEKNAGEVKPYREYNFPTDRDAVNAVLKLNSFLSDKFNSLKNLYDNTPTPNTTGGAGYIPSNTYAEGGQPEIIDLPAPQSPEEMLALMLTLPQPVPMEQPDMPLAPELPIPPAPLQLVVENQESEEPEESQRKPAEEMSTKELNEALEEIIQYAKDIKDRLLLREAKRIQKKGSREEKEEFVDDTFEEIDSIEAEQPQEEQAVQEELPLEPELPTESVEPVMAEGGVIQEQPVLLEQLQQASLENAYNIIQILLEIGQQLGHSENELYTPEEVDRIIQIAGELGIDISALGTEDSSQIADILNRLIMEQLTPEGQQVLQTPQVSDTLIPQGGNILGRGGNVETKEDTEVGLPFEEKTVIKLPSNVNEGVPGLDDYYWLNYTFSDKINTPLTNSSQEEASKETSNNYEYGEQTNILPEIEVAQQRPRHNISQLVLFMSMLPLELNPFESAEIVEALRKQKGSAQDITKEDLSKELLLNEISKRTYDYLMGNNNIFAEGGDMFLDNPSQNIYAGSKSSLTREERKWARKHGYRHINRLTDEEQNKIKEYVKKEKEYSGQWGETYTSLSPEEQMIALDKINSSNKNDYDTPQEILLAVSDEMRLRDIRRIYPDVKEVSEDPKVDAINDALIPESWATPSFTRPDTWDYSTNGRYVPETDESGYDFSTLYGNDDAVVTLVPDIPIAHSNGEESIGMTYEGYGKSVTPKDLRKNGAAITPELFQKEAKEGREALITAVERGDPQAIATLKWLGRGTTKSNENLYFDDLGNLREGWQDQYRKLYSSGAWALNHLYFKKSNTPPFKIIYKMQNPDNNNTWEEVYGLEPSLYKDYYNVTEAPEDADYIKDRQQVFYLLAPNDIRNLVRVGNKVYQLPETVEEPFTATGEPVTTTLYPGRSVTDQYYDLGEIPPEEEGSERKQQPNKWWSFLRWLPMFLNRPFLDGYSSANLLSLSADNLRYIDAPRHGEYLKYSPVDSLYRMNQLQLANNGTVRGITGLSNLNQGTLLSNLALQNAKNQQAMGELAVNTDLENWGRYKDAVEQHNKTDNFMDQLSVDADKANMTNNQYIAQARQRAADRLYEIEKDNNAAKSAYWHDILAYPSKMLKESRDFAALHDFLNSGAVPGAKEAFPSAYGLGTNPYVAEGGNIRIRRKRRKRLS